MRQRCQGKGVRKRCQFFPVDIFRKGYVKAVFGYRQPGGVAAARKINRRLTRRAGHAGACKSIIEPPAAGYFNENGNH